MVRKQAEVEFRFNVFRDDLRSVVGFENDRAPIANNRNLIITLPGQLPYQRAVLRGNIGDLEALATEFEDPLLDQAKRTPWNLDEFDHSPRLPAIAAKALTCSSTI